MRKLRGSFGLFFFFAHSFPGGVGEGCEGTASRRILCEEAVQKRALRACCHQVATVCGSVEVQRNFESALINQEDLNAPLLTLRECSMGCVYVFAHVCYLLTHLVDFLVRTDVHHPHTHSKRHSSMRCNDFFFLTFCRYLAFKLQQFIVCAFLHPKMPWKGSRASE